MKVLVTGGAGYIGSHVTDLLVTRGYEVVVFDNLYTGHAEAVHKDAAFVKGDLLDKPAVDAVFAAHPFDGILHFASHTLVGESMEKPWLYLRDNAVAASNLLEAAARQGVKRFILSSTANLFDDPAKNVERIEATIVHERIPGGRGQAGRHDDGVFDFRRGRAHENGILEWGHRSAASQSDGEQACCADQRSHLPPPLEHESPAMPV